MVRSEVCNYQLGTVLVTDKLLWGITLAIQGTTFMSKHLILATVEFVNSYLPQVYQNWHFYVSAKCV